MISSSSFVPVRGAALPRVVPPAADPELIGVQVIAGEPSLDAFGAARLDVFEVLDRVVGSHAVTLPNRLSRPAMSFGAAAGLI
jgi:hypothetical protein